MSDKIESVQTTGLTFGQALEAAKTGARIAREGWNGNRRPNYFTPEGRAPVRGYGLVWITLSNGEVAVCDEADYELVAQHPMWSEGNGYPFFTLYEEGTSKTVKLHQLLNPTWKETDHINGDPLDNRRENLRECTSAQNNANRKSVPGSTSRFKGVSWDSSRGKWISSIQSNRATKHLGRFDNEEEAARAYDLAAREIHGDFARLNFPTPRMWVTYSPGHAGLPAANFWAPANKAYAHERGGAVEVLPCMTMKTADNKILMGWLASQTDMLASDWEIVP